MPAHEFEKIVQQKMESLKVTPSDAVWNTVEVEIRKTRRRRRFLLALPLLLLIGTGTFWGWQQFQPSSVVQTEKNASNDKEHTSPGTAAAGMPQTSPSEQDHGKPGDLTPGTQQPQGLSSKTGNPPQNEGPITAATTPVRLPGDILTGIPVAGSKKPTLSVSRKKNFSHFTQKQSQTGIQKGEGGTPISHEEGSRHIGYNVNPGPGSLQVNNNISSEKEWAFANRIGLERSFLDKSAITASQPLTTVNVQQAVSTKVVKIPTASKWHWGVTANVGTSKLVDGTLQGAFEKSLAPATGSYLIDTSLARPGPVGLPSLAPNPSSVKPALHAGIGGFVKRDINSRLSVSTGVEYSYYSTQINVGEKVDSSRVVNTSNSTLSVNRFYKNEASGRYINKYHFIEVPITAEYLFNKNMPVPFSVFGGATIGYMFSTNALQYDHFYGVYYRDDKSFNRMQLGVQAGVRFQVTRHGRQALEIGPVFNYKLKNMANDNSGNTSHLLSGAINLRWHWR